MGGNFTHRLGVFNQASGSDVVFAVQDFVTGTSTGAQSFTSATITGVTPAAALVLQPNHDPTNDPGETAILSVGFAAIQGTTDLSAFSWSRDNNASTSVFSSANAKGHQVFNNSGSTVKQADGQTVSGGIELNYTTNTSPSLRGAFAAFAGADVSAKAAEVNLGTGTSAIDITAPAFEPDVVLLFGNGFQFNGAAGTPFFYTFGICTNDGTQRCVMWAETGSLADSRPFQTLRDDCAGGRIADSTGALTYKTTVSDFDANGFSITPSASASSNRIAYLAIKTTDRQVKLADFDTPTATGSHTITGAGFTPRFALAVVTNLEAVNDHPGSTSDNQAGFAACFIGDEQWAASWRINAGEATTDTASQLSNVALMGASATDCDAIKATFTAWTSDGVTLNFSAVQGTAKKGFILFIE